ncbi:MAG: hypothetical protein WDA02_08070 [Saccharofermentanales bacterium]
MPIQEKDLGKYKRPGIYIEEIDNSIIELPAQNLLINLVPGFSKKGPVNKPIYVDNRIEFERIFGKTDRQLENKGSYFHRTVNKMLETGPVWALNLLKTLPNRDVLSYVSVSTSSLYQNSPFDKDLQFQSDYDRFFNRQDFWERDSESFLDVVNDPTPDNDRLLHLTNMGDKTITVFMFKSELKGFDMTATDWYGGDVNVPTYIHPKSLISDYIITVLVLSGDWSNYKDLSVDPRWSKYFTINGLITSSVQDFVNEYGVVSLGAYDVSLIPNFKDINNNDMYIENIINNNTDRTGLFCSFNKELLEDSEYLSDLVDLIGNNIVGTDVETINFLSYNQAIKEELTYGNIGLDTPNNVMGTTSFGTRTNYWNNWTQRNITNDTFNSSSRKLSFTITDNIYIINGKEYTLTNNEVEVYPLSEGNQRLDVVYLDSNGLHIMNGSINQSGSTPLTREINFDNENSIILGTILVSNTNETYSGTFEWITESDDSGNLNIVATNEGDHLKIEFLGTSGNTIRNYEYKKLRLHKIYQEMSKNLQLNKGVIINVDGIHKSEIIDINSLSYSSSNNSQIHIYLDNPSDYISTDKFVLYYTDNEFNISASAVELKTSYDTTTNIVARYSKFYLDYLNGEISNGDVLIDSNGNKVYLKMFIDSDVISVKFSYDKNGEPTETINGEYGITIKSDLGNWSQTIEIENVSEIENLDNTNTIKIDKDRYIDIKRGMYLESYYDEDYYSGPSGEGYIMGDRTPRKLTRIVDVKNDPNNINLKIIYTDSPIKIMTTDESLNEYYTTSYPPVYSYITNIKGVALKPFKIHIDSMPNGTETRQSDILDVMSKNTPLFGGLVNKNKISWRYLVDSFGLGLTQNSKQQYLDICGKKLNCLGFINMPSARQFKKSVNPSYINDDGSLSTLFIKEGADQDKNPNFLYSFGDGSGRSTVGYFFPYVRITENNETRFVPPAANAATAYMRKFTTSTAGIYPHTIVAGVNTGRLPDISGTEMDFTDNDLDNLSEMGCNPIIFIRNVGYIINDENTAQVFPVSSLSYMHSREVLIELENELYDMLLRYQWKFNTPGIRSEIKYRADMICQKYLDMDALYAYRNICDTTNNTNYIIDLQGGVLDTHIEIVKGMGWIVNNITIEKTGTINSTGFQQ